jgi:hypothetical protein
MNIIMGATLHQPAPDSYFGHWLARFPRESRSRTGGQCPFALAPGRLPAVPLTALDEIPQQLRGGGIRDFLFR